MNTVHTVHRHQTQPATIRSRPYGRPGQTLAIHRKQRQWVIPLQRVLLQLVAWAGLPCIQLVQQWKLHWLYYVGSFSFLFLFSFSLFSPSLYSLSPSLPYIADRARSTTIAPLAAASVDPLNTAAPDSVRLSSALDCFEFALKASGRRGAFFFSFGSRSVLVRLISFRIVFAPKLLPAVSIQLFSLFACSSCSGCSSCSEFSSTSRFIFLICNTSSFRHSSLLQMPSYIFLLLGHEPSQYPP